MERRFVRVHAGHSHWRPRSVVCRVQSSVGGPEAVAHIAHVTPGTSSDRDPSSTGSILAHRICVTVPSDSGLVRRRRADDMTWAVRRTTVLLLLAIPSVVLGLSAPVPAVAAPAPTAGNAWTEIQHPRPGGADTYLNDVVIPAAGDVWSVGYTFDVVGGAFEFRTFGQHCVSGTCERANLPSREGAPATNFLYGIDAVSPTDMWTVGYSRDPGRPGIGLAIRYDGTSWRIVDTPNPSGSTSTSLQAVAAISATSAVAVGTYQDGATFEERPLAMRWNGSSWSLLTVPTVAGCRNVATLFDAADLNGTVYAAGTCRSTAGQDAGIVLALRGSTWTVLLGPQDGVLPVPSTLASITVVPGPGGIAVVGSDGVTGQPLAGYLNGRSWALSAPVPSGSYGRFQAVAATSPSKVWAVGLGTEAVPLRISQRWNGRAWVAVPAGGPTILAGVAYDPAGYWWAVGHDNSVSVIQRIAAP